MDNMNNNVYAQYTVQKKKRNGMAVASMVLGIISLVMCCIIYVSMPCAVLSIILGAVSLRKGKNGMAVAGIILGAIAMVIAILVFTLMIVGIIVYLETNGIEYSLYRWGLLS